MKKKLYFKKSTKKSLKDHKKHHKKEEKDKKINLFQILSKSTYSLKVFTLINLISITAALGLFMLQLLDTYSAIVQQRNEYVLQYQYWYQVTTKYSNYPDAYYNLALYALRLNLKDKAYQYATHALELDPEFKQAESLKEEIVGKG